MLGQDSNSSCSLIVPWAFFVANILKIVNPPLTLTYSLSLPLSLPLSISLSHFLSLSSSLTSSLSLSQFLSLFPSLSLPFSLFPSLSLPLSLSLSPSLSHFHSITISLFLMKPSLYKHSLGLTHSLAVSHTLSQSHTHSLSLTHSLSWYHTDLRKHSLSHSLTLFKPWFLASKAAFFLKIWRKKRLTKELKLFCFCFCFIFIGGSRKLQIGPERADQDKVDSILTSQKTDLFLELEAKIKFANL